jgi:hypothetical protein
MQIYQKTFVLRWSMLPEDALFAAQIADDRYQIPVLLNREEHEKFNATVRLRWKSNS